MTILAPLIAQALGRSPYDEEVWHFAGQPTPNETTQRHQHQYDQQYDQRGRPVNPTTRRINRDIIRAHNEVMLAIGVVEPETSWQETLAKEESVRRHRRAETTLAKGLLFVNGIIEKSVVWGVDGMRQRIMIYKEFARSPILDLFRPGNAPMTWRSYLFAGLPSYVVNHLYEHIYLPEFLDIPAVEYLIAYIRLHLEVFSFLQRLGISPSDAYLPPMRFFIPGTSISPLPIPPLPSSLGPSHLLGWVSALALGAAPFVGFCLVKRFSIQLTDMLKYKYHSLVPAPINRRKQLRSPLRDVTSEYYPDGTDPAPGVENIPPDHHQPGVDIQEDATVHTDDNQTGPSDAFPVGTVRRQSAASGREDEFASDEEENEMVRAAIISIEVGPAEAATGNNDVLGEIRPHREDNAEHDPVYRENTFTLLPSFFGASAMGLTTFRILSTPWEGFALSSIARSYMRRGGLSLDNTNSLDLAGQFRPWARWGSTCVLELVLFNAVGWSSLVLSMILFKSKKNEEEWEEREKRKRLEEARITVEDHD